MNKPIISIIAAIGDNKELGKNNKLLWHIPEDLKFFREKTRGHAVIMGRKTYKSIGHPLPNRVNIIISRNSNLKINGAFVVHSLEEALSLAKQHEKEEIFIIGGAQIYQEALPIVDKLYLTLVQGTFAADVFFPDYSDFKKIIDQKTSSDRKLTFLELER